MNGKQIASIFAPIFSGFARYPSKKEKTRNYEPIYIIDVYNPYGSTSRVFVSLSLISIKTYISM